MYVSMNKTFRYMFCICIYTYGHGTKKLSPSLKASGIPDAQSFNCSRTMTMRHISMADESHICILPPLSKCVSMRM